MNDQEAYDAWHYGQEAKGRRVIGEGMVDPASFKKPDDCQCRWGPFGPLLSGFFNENCRRHGRNRAERYFNTVDLEALATLREDTLRKWNQRAIANWNIAFKSQPILPDSMKPDSQEFIEFQQQTAAETALRQIHEAIEHYGNLQYNAGYDRGSANTETAILDRRADVAAQLDQVRTIVGHMRSIASQGAFISKDPYELTEALSKALGLEPHGD